MSVEVLRAHITAMYAAHGDVKEACSVLLAHERKATNSMEELHGSLSVLAEALQRATRTQRALAQALALDPDLLASNRPLVEPLLEGSIE